MRVQGTQAKSLKWKCNETFPNVPPTSKLPEQGSRPLAHNSSPPHKFRPFPAAPNKILYNHFIVYASNALL